MNHRIYHTDIICYFIIALVNLLNPVVDELPVLLQVQFLVVAHRRVDNFS